MSALMRVVTNRSKDIFNTGIMPVFKAVAAVGCRRHTQTLLLIRKAASRDDLS